MTFSLNEIEAMCKRAARGAGLSWGLAEEAGKAARWLAMHGFPGPKALAALLTDNDGKPYAALAPETVGGGWRARTDLLCPLITGAALCDRAADIATGDEIALGPTAHPLLLAPFAAGVADATGTAIQLSWAGSVFVLQPAGVSAKGDQAALTTRRADSLRCRRVELAETRSPQRTATSRRAIDAETWHCLNTLAIRTYAPATDASRLAGAGAGLRDND